MNATLEVTEYRATEAGLADLRQRLDGITFDVTTTKGDKEARAARLELVKLRTGIEAKRKEIKAPALAYCQLIDSEAKRITAEIVKLEDPIDRLIKAEEARKAAEKEERERLERERITAIHECIQTITRAPALLIGKTSAVIQAALDDMRTLPVTEELFFEFTESTLATRERAVAQIADMLQATLAQEAEAARLRAEREELARQQAEQRRIEAETAAARRAQEEADRTRREAEEQAHRKELARQQAAAAEERRKIEEADRIERAAQQARIAAEAAELKRQQEEFNAQQEAARAQVDDINVVESPEAFVPMEAQTRTRPTHEQIVMAVADAFGVSRSEAYAWLMDFSQQEQAA